jgi:hypothetical protein
MLDILVLQFRNALYASGARDIKKYYAYAHHNLPPVPPQVTHQDCSKGRAHGSYFTDLIPISVDAEPTEFGRVPPFLTFQAPVMFGGNVWHRGPGVGANARVIISLVACKNDLNVNRDSAIPYPWPCSPVVSPCSSVKSLSDLRVSSGVRCSQLDARMLQETLQV